MYIYIYVYKYINQMHAAATSWSTFDLLTNLLLSTPRTDLTVGPLTNLLLSVHALAWHPTTN